ncbi:MAG: S-methyl-5-thioribose-1-phosphate isomerase [Betaproteobacteria bacterium]|nr:MAG: S-methyl-5-thioribose-1-phosphate isomerase [Betaproteobacteria bacterium]
MSASSEAIPVETLRWRGARLELIDQRALPARLEYVSCTNAAEVAEAIRSMVVRGAPAIGCAAAFGVALEAKRQERRTRAEFDAAMEIAFKSLAASRPTAVNLFWALDQMRAALGAGTRDDPSSAAGRLADTAVALFNADLEINRAIGRAGAALVPDGARVLTHCNTGALATAGHGTALGVIRSARDAGKRVSVIASETRPYLQGARLTAWEMIQERIPVTLVIDSTAGHLMSRGEVDVVIVGADRVAANGDVANKIGTYTVAVLAERHHIPFYVAAPLSSIDTSSPDGGSIPIEERGAAEVTGYAGMRWAPEGIAVANPAFDITPAALVSALFTEKGVLERPDANKIRSLFER